MQHKLLLLYMRQINLFKCWLVIVGLLFTSCGSPANESRNSNTPGKLLLVSFDGFMNEYIERNETPNFDRLIANGVKAEYMIPIFPTKTFPNHYTIATGLYAENHGIIANGFYDDSLDARFRFGPIDSPNDERWWGGEPIWITAENQGLTSATFFWPGSEASIDGVQSTKWVQYDGEVPQKTRIDSILAWMDPNGLVQADFGSLYFSLVDAAGHGSGPNSEETNLAVQRADSLLGYLLDGMNKHGLADNLNLIVTSDHGMAELSPEKVVFLDELIDLDEVELIDWTPVAMIKPDEGKSEEVYRELKKNENNYRVFMKSELPDHYRFTEHYRIPEIIMIADVGYTITSREFFEDRGVLGGTHGFDHEIPEMRTIFFADGPAFKNGVEVNPFQSVHIYELMCRILGLDPAENDGNIQEIEYLLNN